MNQIQEYIIQAEFCRRMGISKQALQQAIKRGRVAIEMHHGRKMIEYHANRRSYIQTARTPERYTANNVERRLKHPKKNGKQDQNPESKSGFHPLDLVADPPDEDGDFHSGMSRLEAESIKQVYLAKQAKLKFLKSAGLLIETEVVKKEWEEIAVRVQKSMLAIPDRVSEIYASLSDADKIYQDMTAEIRHALSSLQYRVKIEDEHDHIEKIVEEEIKTESGRATREAKREVS